MHGETLPDLSCDSPPGELGGVLLPVPLRLLVHVNHCDGHAREDVKLLVLT